MARWPFADSLLHTGGEIGFMPDGLLGEDPEQVAAITDAVRGVLDQEFERLLLGHGDPIVGGGHDALAEFVGHATKMPAERAIPA